MCPGNLQILGGGYQLVFPANVGMKWAKKKTCQVFKTWQVWEVGSCFRFLLLIPFTILGKEIIFIAGEAPFFDCRAGFGHHIHVEMDVMNTCKDG